LPPALQRGPFTVRTAREHAVPAWRLRHPGLHTPTRSVRLAAPPGNEVERAAAFMAALPPDVAFSHVTAAQLWGLSLPRRLAGQEPLDVMRPSSATRIRRRGCLGHRGLESRTTARSQGLAVTGLADTWVDLGEVLDRGLGLEDLVVLGDEVATRTAGPPDPGSDGPDWSAGRLLLAEALASRVRPRGASLLARALELVRAPVRSPMETRARLMFLRAGLPEPRVNLAVHGANGQWLLEGDLVWQAQCVVGEYQGRDHASIRQRSYDENRRALAEDEGWTVLEVYAEDVFRPARRAACVDRFARALGVDARQVAIG
jgi:hypothetical protein